MWGEMKSGSIPLVLWNTLCSFFSDTSLVPKSLGKHNESDRNGNCFKNIHCFHLNYFHLNHVLVKAILGFKNKHAEKCFRSDADSLKTSITAGRQGGGRSPAPGSLTGHSASGCVGGRGEAGRCPQADPCPGILPLWVSGLPYTSSKSFFYLILSLFILIPYIPCIVPLDVVQLLDSL